MKSSLVNMVLSLGIITIAAAAILGGVYAATKGPIEEAAQAKQVEAVKAVTPDFNNDPVAEMTTVVPEGEERALKVFPARQDGRLVGTAVESYSMNGFSGEITLIYGFDTEGTLTGFEVMTHQETPGLGAKMDEWFKPAEGVAGAEGRTVIGRNPASTNFTVSKDGGDIDAITAATITSRAFLDALARASRANQAFVQHETGAIPAAAVTGATPKAAQAAPSEAAADSTVMAETEDNTLVVAEP